MRVDESDVQDKGNDPIVRRPLKVWQPLQAGATQSRWLHWDAARYIWICASMITSCDCSITHQSYGGEGYTANSPS